MSKKNYKPINIIITLHDQKSLTKADYYKILQSQIIFKPYYKINVREFLIVI